MAFTLKAPLAIAVAFAGTAAAAGGTYMLVKHLEETTPQEPGTCENTYFAQGRDCLAKDADGNPISIAIDTPPTPRP